MWFNKYKHKLSILIILSNYRLHWFIISGNKLFAENLINIQHTDSLIANLNEALQKIKIKLPDLHGFSKFNLWLILSSDISLLEIVNTSYDKLSDQMQKNSDAVLNNIKNINNINNNYLLDIIKIGSDRSLLHAAHENLLIAIRSVVASHKNKIKVHYLARSWFD